MIVMVTGSRDWRDIDTIRTALETVGVDLHNDLLHGCASGADAIARALAESMGWKIWDFWPDYAHMPFAEANKSRNLEMVAYPPDVVLAFPTHGSRGTWHTVNAAKRAGYVEGETLFVHSLEEDEGVLINPRRPQL